MSAPPWGHKPPAVNPYDYWSHEPPTPSPRLGYWLRRLEEGTWVPNKYFNHEGYDGRAHWLGVYLWEYLHVILPALLAQEARPREAG